MADTPPIHAASSGYTPRFNGWNSIMKPLQIIGCGPGALDYLTWGGLQAALRCDCLLGPLHLLKIFKEYNGPRITSLARAVDAVAQI